jgi:ABC-type Mn/Zn transport systems, ATPase component
MMIKHSPTLSFISELGCMQKAVEILNLSFFYNSAEPVLQNIHLTMQAGELLAIIGPNGGGKTTLLRLMLGLLQPEADCIRIFGALPAEISGNIGYVPQFSTLRPDFPATVLETVLMGGTAPSWFGGSWSRGKKAKDRAMSYLDVLGLADCSTKPVGSLSGGQRQRALVARALMSKPERDQNGGTQPPFLLLLDEPTASIDPQGKFCFYEFLGKLKGSISIIVVSHDLFMVSPFFSSIAFVNKTLTRLNGSELSPENLTLLFGQHMHDCPVADMQHAGGLQHHEGCSHHSCTGGDDAPSRPSAPMVK